MVYCRPTAGHAMHEPTHLVGHTAGPAQGRVQSMGTEVAAGAVGTATDADLTDLAIA